MKNIALWVVAVSVALAVCVAIIWNLPTPQTRVVRVATVGSDLHLGTTSHYFGLSTGEVVRIDGNDWVIIRVGHCYRIDANTSHIYDATEVPCD